MDQSNGTANSRRPSLLSKQEAAAMRKISSSGRFTILGPPTASASASPSPPRRISASADPEVPTTSSAATLHNDTNTKTVHFNVGEQQQQQKAITEDDSFDNTATGNFKSWRYLQTLEHPPIMQFYRNMNSFEGGDASMMVARPSMIELLHGGGSVVGLDGMVAAGIEMKELKDETAIGVVLEKEQQRLISVGPTVETHQDRHQMINPLKGSSPSKSSLQQQQQKTRFGWVEGVFFRCLLNIFGVMLYLRVSWVAGQAGIIMGSGVILLASLVTTITALSTCAICTNGSVRGGGAYFLISRSLGAEYGGSIGLIFSVANAVGAAMYVVGFAETVRDLLKECEIILLDGDLMLVRVIGLITCSCLMAIVFIGTSFESKMQMGLLVILTLSILDYFMGTFLPVTEEQSLKGITGYSMSTFKENLLPAFRSGHDFFSVLSIYFPAATGIMAGANISGDLADPQRAIPLGTLLAIAVTTGIYLLTVITTGSTSVRDADGVNPPMLLLTRLRNESSSNYVQPACALNETCTYGLMNHFQIMELESLWGPLITAGIFAATLSSALASLVSAPKIFQAVAKDGLFPYIDYFSKGFGKNDEPRRAYALAFVIAVLIVLVGDLNAIAPIISNFFLCSYALINYACFDASFAHSPGFRPSFRYYNMWVSLAGALLCVSVMFIISWVTALLTFFFFAVIFMYVARRKPDVNWGSSTQAHSYRNALQYVTKLESTDDHIKNYRPQILALTGNLAIRPSLVDFCYNISKGSSLMVCGYVVPYPPSDSVFSMCRRLADQLRVWLKKRHIKAFVGCVANTSRRAGAQALLQAAGLGKLRPNILVMGFKQQWSVLEGEGSAVVAVETALIEINDYFGIIQDSFDCNLGVAILRSGAGGLDFSDMLRLHNLFDASRFNAAQQDDKKVTKNSSNGNGDSHHLLCASSSINQAKSDGQSATDKEEASMEDEDYWNREEEEDVNSIQPSAIDVDGVEAQRVSTTPTDSASRKPNAAEDANGDLRYESKSDGEKGDDFTADKRNLMRRRSSRRLTTAQRELLTSVNRFQRRIKGGVIDVWWLYDDGGLTLLIPYLLTQPKSYLEKAKLRVFTVSTSSSAIEQEQRNMASLLAKFRIEYSDLHVIADIARRPKKETVDAFNQLIAPFRVIDTNNKEGLITDSELSAQRDKTMRQLRVGELLRQHSTEADLIVLSLPVPRRGLVSSSLYMAWLDMMTRDLPPTLLVRGNQQSVLTFYS